MRMLSNLYMYPTESVRAIVDYSLADPEVTTDIEQEAIDTWGWKKGMEWLGNKVVKLALLSVPNMLGYYSLFGKLPM